MRVKAREFTEEEAMAYFATVFEEYNYRVVNKYWDTFLVNAAPDYLELTGEYDNEQHFEEAFNIEFRTDLSDTLHKFVIWFEDGKVYGEW